MRGAARLIALDKSDASDIAVRLHAASEGVFMHCALPR